MIVVSQVRGSFALVKSLGRRWEMMAKGSGAGSEAVGRKHSGERSEGSGSNSKMDLGA